jgi:hypothetical protein
MTTTPLGTKLGIRKITARIGAEITGLSPDLTLDPETVGVPLFSGRCQPQRTPRDSSAARLACTDATARNASRR